MKEIILKGVIGWDVFAEDIRKQLPAGSEKVTLLINSGGGDVFEAFEIYNLLKDYSGKVTARITGLAASAAADIFFGADDREWYSHSAIMYHRAWTITLGNAEELRKEADILDGLDKIRVTDFAKITGKTPEDAMKEFTDETWLLGDEQIRAKGISGTLIDGSEGEEISEAMARSRVAKAIAQLKETREAKDFTAASREKIAALVQKQDKSAKADENNHGGLSMNFSEFIAQNPGAENDVLAYAKSKIGPGADEAAIKKAESDRISEIFALAGVQISDDVKAAVTGGITPEAYAKNALIKQREIEAKLKTGEGIKPTKVAQTIGEQAGETAEAGKGEPVTEESARAVARVLGGRR